MRVLNPILFLAAGGIFGLLFILVTLVRTLGGAERITFWELTLSFMVTILMIMALITNTELGLWLPAIDQSLDRVVLIAAAALSVFSLLIVLIETRRPQRLQGSRGILGIWVGLLLVISTFLVPLASTFFVFEPQGPELLDESGEAIATEEVALAGATVDVDAPPPTDTPVPTDTPTERPTSTPTITRTPQPTPTLTSTRYTFATRTDEPTPTLVSPCLATVNFNLRLRSAPDGESETIDVVPFETTIPLFARTEDSLWWYGSYDDQLGWLDGEFMRVASNCDDLPIRQE